MIGNVKICMQLFKLAVGTSFGWNTSSYTDSGYNAFLNGKACSTGFAYISAANVATCYNLTVVKTGAGLPTANVQSPWSCTIGN